MTYKNLKKSSKNEKTNLKNSLKQGSNKDLKKKKFKK